VVFDIEARRLDVDLADQEIKNRLANWREPEPRYKSGVFPKYAALVSSASEGAVTRVDFGKSHQLSAVGRSPKS